MRNILVFLLAMFFTVSSFAFDPKVELNESKIVMSGECNYKDTRYRCFILKKEDKLFMVALDERGPVAIFTLKELKASYEDKEATLVWERPIQNRNTT